MNEPEAIPVVGRDPVGTMVRILFIVTDPVVDSEPVMVWLSVDKFPILTPAFVTWNSIALPVNTVNDPEYINSDPVESILTFSVAICGSDGSSTLLVANDM